MNISVLLLVLLIFSSQQNMTLHGHVICLLEEKGAASDHAHEYGFKTSDGVVRPLHRSLTAEALFTDERVRKQELELLGRVHPEDDSFEAIQIYSVKDGVRHEVYYWCDTCHIRSTAPGPCWCCYEPFELKEVPVN
jgi:hypothetical protein